jgi:hypothetical protein
MKTAGRENQKRYTTVVASRDHGTEDENNPAQWGGLDGKKKSGHRRSVFFLTSFIELMTRGRTAATLKSGGVAEWLKAAVLKTVRPGRVSGVRIPPPPPP